MLTKTHTQEVAAWDAMLQGAERLVKKNHRGEWRRENFDVEKLRQLASQRKMSEHFPFEEKIAK